jgi:glycine betaine/proline transport system substrate-binding protein
VNCIVGWACNKIMRVKATAYGLDEYYNVMEPATDVAIASAIAGAYERGEPILSYYWEPTWVLGKYNMTQLEEPPYTDECWAKIIAATEQDPLGQVDEACAYQTYDIHKGIYAGLLERAPEVVAFLQKIFIGTDRLNELSAYMEENDATADETAIYYLKNFEDQWTGWVPAEVAEKVKAALP